MSRPKFRPKLSRSYILEAALGLIDREGTEALSMRKLGAELGVEAMSLYRHVANRETVLDGVVELLTEKLDIPAPSSRPWQEEIRQVADAYRRLARSHPRAFPLLALRPFVTPRAAEWEGAVLELFRKTGLDALRTHFAFRTFGSFTAGHLLEETAAAPAAEGDLERWEAAYEFGIHILLTGLEAERVKATETN